MTSAVRRNLILTGFMGTGKTTVAAQLVERLGYEGVDTDAAIEARHGAIPAIFAARGEAGFRAIERVICQELTASEGLVISAGGGMLLDTANAELLAATGEIYCLTARPETILERVTGEGIAERPLLAGGDPLIRIRELLASRAEHYGGFLQVATDERSPAEIADEILGRFKSG